MSNRTRFVRAALVFAFLTAGSALTGCGGGGSSSGNQVCSPTDSTDCAADYTVYCPYLSGAPPQLIYPAPAAMNVPDDLNEMVIADASTANYNNPNAAYQLYLSTIGNEFTLANDNGGPNDTISGALVSISPSQIPAPAATTSIVNPIYEVGVMIYGGFAPSSVYYVYFSEIAASGPNVNCAPQGPIASFTTAPASSTTSVKSYSHPPMPARELLRLRS